MMEVLAGVCFRNAWLISIGPQGPELLKTIIVIPSHAQKRSGCGSTDVFGLIVDAFA